ncbi:MAG: hypothetical protein JXM69_13090 [Anaerolineae bacterium]|nr:hypothetical protein [Anaerolineae bacterium]
MSKLQQRYLSYLLRLWQTDNKPTWRASLESLTGERQGFASLEELFDYLKTQTNINDNEEASEDNLTNKLNHQEQI